MARQIKETPILTGKDAERFQKIIKQNEHKKVPQSDFDRAKNAYNNFEVINSTERG